MKNILFLFLLVIGFESFSQTKNPELINEIIASSGEDTKIHGEFMPWTSFMDLNMLNEKNLEVNWDAMAENTVSAEFEEFIECCDLKALQKQAENTQIEDLSSEIKKSGTFNTDVGHQSILKISKPLFCKDKKWGLICTSYLTTAPSKEKFQSDYLKIFQYKGNEWVLINSIQLGFN